MEALEAIVHIEKVMKNITGRKVKMETKLLKGREILVFKILVLQKI